jgi:hypothetical protein
MSHLAKVLLWPIISLLITGGLHFALEGIWPELKATFIPAVLAPLLLAYGVWVGSRMVELGGWSPSSRWTPTSHTSASGS